MSNQKMSLILPLRHLRASSYVDRQRPWGCVCGSRKVQDKTGPEPTPRFKGMTPALDPEVDQVF